MPWFQWLTSPPSSSYSPRAKSCCLMSKKERSRSSIQPCSGSLTYSSFFFYKKTITSRWAFHSARINSLSWTADSKHCASGSLDTNVYVWSVAKPMKNIAIKEAGPGGVNTVLWLEGGRSGKLVSAGADACARIWEVTFHS